MSVAAKVARTASEQRREPSLREPAKYRVFSAVVVAVDVLVLAALAPGSGPVSGIHPRDLMVWIALAALSSLAPVPSGRGAWLAFDLPIVLGAGLVFGPLGAGLVGLIGAFDIRELRRDLSLSRALFNRAQVSLSGIAGAAVFHSLGGDLGAWPAAAAIGVAALAADCLVNYALVAMSSSVLRCAQRHVRRIT